MTFKLEQDTRTTCSSARQKPFNGREVQIYLEAQPWVEGVGRSSLQAPDYPPLGYWAG